MATKKRRFRCTPDEVFRVLGDGWLYPGWVVGASRMRDVDEEWPAPGSKLQHSVGLWPLLLDDSTSCEEWAPPHFMVLKARGWPIGEARVNIQVHETDEGCVVNIDEEAESGPAAWIPHWFTGWLLKLRNRETLRRLSYLAEGLASQPDTRSP